MCCAIREVKRGLLRQHSAMGDMESGEICWLPNLSLKHQPCSPSPRCVLTSITNPLCEFSKGLSSLGCLSFFIFIMGAIICEVGPCLSYLPPWPVLYPTSTPDWEHNYQFHRRATQICGGSRVGTIERWREWEMRWHPEGLATNDGSGAEGLLSSLHS